MQSPYEDETRLQESWVQHLKCMKPKTRVSPQMLVAFYCNFPLKKQASQKAGLIWPSTTRVLRRFLPQLTCLDQVWIAWNAERAWPAHFFRIWLLCGWRLETQIERREQGCFKRDQVLSQLLAVAVISTLRPACTAAPASLEMSLCHRSWKVSSVRKTNPERPDRK